MQNKPLYNKALRVHIAKHIHIENNERINVANMDVCSFSRPPCEDIHDNTQTYMTGEPLVRYSATSRRSFLKFLWHLR